MGLDTVTETPTWWTHQHATAWEKVKDALERDWEQTKADFSNNNGHRLNQNAADTVSQGVGWANIPSLDQKTRPTDPAVAVKVAEKAHAKMQAERTNAVRVTAVAHRDAAQERQALGATVAEVRKDLAEQQAKTSATAVDATAKANKSISAAQETAIEGIAKGDAMVAEACAKRDGAVAAWREAEQEVRYGYSVRGETPAGTVWDDALEGKLRREWEALHPGRPWDASRTEVHRGWDYAGKKA